MLQRQLTAPESPPAEETGGFSTSPTRPLDYVDRDADTADDDATLRPPPLNTAALSPSNSSNRAISPSCTNNEPSPANSIRSLASHDSQERPHSTSHRSLSGSGRGTFFRAKSTPSDMGVHSSPWGHSLTLLESVFGSVPANKTLDEIIQTERVTIPHPQARADYYVVYAPSLHFSTVLAALANHRELHKPETFHYFLQRLAPKPHMYTDMAKTVGQVLLVTSSWADPRPFESPAIMDDLCAFELQSNIDKMRVSMCMPQPEFDKIMATWQKSHGSGIKTHVIPSILKNMQHLGSLERETHVLTTLGLWYLNLPLLELLQLEKARTHNQISKQARIIQTLTASLVDNGRLLDAEVLCKLSIRRNQFLWPDEHLDVFSVNLQTLGDLYVQLGRKTDAIMAFQQSLAYDLALMKTGHPETNPAVVSEGLKMVASLLLDMGRLEEAEAKLKSALQIDCLLHSKTKPIVIIESLYHVGAVLEKQKRYADAAAYFSDALVVNATVHGNSSSQVVTNLRTLVQLYDQAGMPNEVEKCLLRLLSVLKLRGQLSESGPVYCALAKIYLASAKYDFAQNYATQAINVDAQVFGRICSEVGRDLALLYRILMAHVKSLPEGHFKRQGLLDEAERRISQAAYVHQRLAHQELCKRALVRSKEKYMQMMMSGAAIDSRAIELSQISFESASLHLALGQTKEAIEEFTSSLRLAIRIKGQDDSSVLLDQADLAKLMFENGDFKGAVDFYRQATASHCKIHGEKNELVAASIFNLAVCLEALGFQERTRQESEFKATLDEAEQQFAEALRVFESLEPQPPERMVCMRRLCQILWNRGKVEGNPVKLHRACSINQRMLDLQVAAGEPKQKLVEARMSFCRLLLDTGLVEQVETQCALAKAEMDTVLEDCDPLYALLLSTLADVWRMRGDLVMADAKIREAIKVLEINYGSEHRAATVFACEHLVPILIARAADDPQGGFLDEAEELVNRSIGILTKSLGNAPHADVCLALLASGDVLLALENFSAAENTYIEAFEMAKVLFGPDVSHPIVARAFESLQDLWAQGEDDDNGSETDVSSTTQQLPQKQLESSASHYAPTASAVASPLPVSAAAAPTRSDQPLKPRPLPDIKTMCGRCCVMM